MRPAPAPTRNERRVSIKKPPQVRPKEDRRFRPNCCSCGATSCCHRCPVRLVGGIASDPLLMTDQAYRHGRESSTSAGSEIGLVITGMGPRRITERGLGASRNQQPAFRDFQLFFAANGRGGKSLMLARHAVYPHFRVGLADNARLEFGGHPLRHLRFSWATTSHQYGVQIVGNFRRDGATAVTARNKMKNGATTSSARWQPPAGVLRATATSGGYKSPAPPARRRAEGHNGVVRHPSWRLAFRLHRIGVVKET